MGSIDLSKAKSRWSTEQAATGESAITGDADSPFAVMDDGLTDLRGLVVKKILKNARVSSVDLSGAVFEGFAQFSACHVESTRFRSAFLNTNVGRSFRSCDFSSANMIRAVLRGEFVACDFTRANLAGAMGTEVRFVGCVFVETNFNKSHLLHATFEDCQFQDCKYKNGSFAGSKFIRSPMGHENLGNTIMDQSRSMLA